MNKFSTTRTIETRGKLGSKVILKASQIEGVGLFASADIPRDELIHETHVFQGGLGWVNIVPNALFNHARTKPNCYIVSKSGRKKLMAKRDIVSGEELLVDYSLDPALEEIQEEWLDA